MFKSEYLSVYFILDPACCAGREPYDVLESALRGGVTMVQWRDKEFSYADAPPLTPPHAGGKTPQEAGGDVLKLQALCQKHSVPFLINDHVELAAEIGADGVHIGQGDMSPEEARRIIGKDKILGLTAFTPEHMAAVNPEIVDYVGTGPVYPTKTDKGKPVLGVEKFAGIAKLSPVPVVGIGGITPDNAAPVIIAGAAGVAMMRSISAADDPEMAAKAFAAKP